MKTVVALDPDTINDGLSSKTSESERARCVSNIEPCNKSSPSVEVEGSISKPCNDHLPNLFAKRAP